MNMSSRNLRTPRRLPQARWLILSALLPALSGCLSPNVDATIAGFAPRDGTAKQRAQADEDAYRRLRQRDREAAKEARDEAAKRRLLDETNPLTRQNEGGGGSY